MPIKQNTIIKFGTGEIAVHAGMTPDLTKGVIALVPQEAMPIGTPSHQPIDSLNPEEIPVLMEFANVESLDAFVAQVKVTRKLMTGELSINGDS